MSTVESSNIMIISKGQSNVINSIVSSSYPSNSPQIQTPPLPPTPLIVTGSLPSSPAPFNDDKPIEKCYKKEKHILLEFDQIVKGRLSIISIRKSLWWRGKKQVYIHLSRIKFILNKKVNDVTLRPELLLKDSIKNLFNHAWTPLETFNSKKKEKGTCFFPFHSIR